METVNFFIIIGFVSDLSLKSKYYMIETEEKQQDETDMERIRDSKGYSGGGPAIDTRMEVGQGRKDF